MELPTTVPEDEMSIRVKEWMLAGENIFANDNYVVFFLNGICAHGYFKEDGVWVYLEDFAEKFLPEARSCVGCPKALSYWCMRV